MTKRKLRYSGLGLAVLTVGAIAACSSSDNNGTPGGGGSGHGGSGHSGGAGGTPGVGGGLAAGGSNTAGTGTGGSATAGTGTGGASSGFACANTAPTNALITDFSNLVASTDAPGQFTFAGGVLGGTFAYQPNALTLSTVTNTVLNVKGNVHDYDGFGLYFNTCYDVKTAGYTGISFSIKGYAGPKGKINFRVQTNANTASNDPVNEKNMKGQCVATDPKNTYPDCHASSIDVPVTATATVVTVNFSQLTGGLPNPVVTGADVVGLEWAFDWTPPPPGTGGSGAGGSSAGGSSAGGSSPGGSSAGGASSGAGGASGGSAPSGGTSSGGSTSAGGSGPMAGPYDADVTIDDVKFIGGLATGGSGGAGGSAAGGSSAGGSTASGGSGGASGGTGGASGGSGGKAGSGG